MTERFNANAEETSVGASGVGPQGSGTPINILGTGGGSGQSAISADQQEANYFVDFEYPIKWDEVSGALAELGDKKKLDQLIDDLNTRDSLLEDYLSTNVVNGVVAGTDITISRAAGVVTINAANQRPGAWTAFTPTFAGPGQPFTVTNNASAYMKLGSLVIGRISCRVDPTTNGYPDRVTNMPFAIANANTGWYPLGGASFGGTQGQLIKYYADPSTTARFDYLTTPTSTVVPTETGAAFMYEAV